MGMRETVRAVVINSQGQAFFVQHNERNPADLGKWSCIGGGLNYADQTHQDCLRREISEEFGPEAETWFTFGPKLFESRKPDRIDHFYLAHFNGEHLTPCSPAEILNHSWFEIGQLSHLSFFFGIEGRLAAEALRLSTQTTGRFVGPPLTLG